MRPADYDVILATIYEAALDSACWPLVVDCIARATHADVTVLFQRSGTRGPRTVLATSPGHAGTQTGTPHCLALDLHSARRKIGLILVQPRHDATALRKEHRALLESLLPHLGRAVHLHRRALSARLQRDGAAQALGGLASGFLLINAGARILHANAAAERTLAVGDPLALSRGLLIAPRADHSQSLHNVVARVAHAAAGSPADAVLSLDRAGRPALSLLISRLSGRHAVFGPDGPLIVVLISDPEDSLPPTPHMLGSLYGLTDIQAELLGALIEGRRLAEYAKGRGVSIETARFHLKQIFEKTRTNRQADLLREVLTNPIVRLARRPIRRRPGESPANSSPARARRRR